MSVKELLEESPFTVVEAVQNRIVNFEDIAGVVVIFRGEPCTLKGYDDEVLGTPTKYLDVHFARPDISDCYAPVCWFAEQISDVGNPLIADLEKTEHKKKKKG